MRQIETMALDDARRVITAAERKAREIGMDDAWMGSIDRSINKAFTARAFDTSIGDLAKNSRPGEQFYGIDASDHGRVMIFAGGLPLRGNDGNVLGGVGGSGGSGEGRRSDTHHPLSSAAQVRRGDYHCMPTDGALRADRVPEHLAGRPSRPPGLVPAGTPT